MMSPVGPNIRLFLKEHGLSDKQIDQLTGDTAINLDLGWNGDNFFDDMQVLIDRYQIDFSEFNWPKYVNSTAELSSPHIIYRFARLILGKEKAVSFTVQKLDPFRKLEPLTLDMIERAIVNKRWKEPSEGAARHGD